MDTTTELNGEVAADERVKPPFLRRVRIRGYRSIEFCDVALEPLTILVGRNGSGKSNFLDALAFVRDSLDDSVTRAARDRNGWKVIQSRSSHSPLIEMGLEASFHSCGREWDADYSFSLAHRAGNRIVVENESLELRDKSGGRLLGYRLAESDLQWIGDQSQIEEPDGSSANLARVADNSAKFPDPRQFRRRRFDRLILGTLGSEPYLILSEGLSRSGYYNFNPAAIREHQPSTGWPFLERDGRNLGRAIEGLREIEPEDVFRLQAYLRAIVPDVEGFRVEDRGDLETVRFIMKRRFEEVPLEFDASSMSDGTLRVLSSLVAAFQISLPTDHGLIAIEEPETALHPAAMRALVDALDEATGRTQILLTTHSADLLDNPTVRPENVRIVQMIDGRTVIGPVDEASVEIVKRQLNTLGGLERENRLEPDLDDLDRQQRLAASAEESPG